MLKLSIFIYICKMKTDRINVQHVSAVLYDKLIILSENEGIRIRDVVIRLLNIGVDHVKTTDPARLFPQPDSKVHKRAAKKKPTI